MNRKRTCIYAKAVYVWFFNVADMAFMFIALSNLSNDLTKPSPLKAAILQIRLIPLIEDKVIAIKIWLTPNYVALCHTEGKELPKPFTMF